MAAGLAAILVMSAPFVVPNGIETLQLIAARQDPVKFADIRLARLTPADYETAIDEALQDGDTDLAASLVDLAEQRQVALPGSLLDRVDTETAEKSGLTYQLGEIWNGAITGKADSAAGLAGAVALDFTTIGDVRDILMQGEAYLNGEHFDPLILGLSIAGLTMTGAVMLSVGTASPPRIGVAAIKAAGKAGKINKSLLKSFARLTTRTVNTKALGETLPLLKAGDFSRASKVASGAFNAAPLSTMQKSATELGTVMTKNGVRAGTDVLKIADKPADIAKLGKLSSGFGKRFRAVLALLGSGAIAGFGWLTAAAGWSATFLTWLAGAAWFGFKAIRLSWRFALLPLGRMLARSLA
ncbi:hypothetical protein [Martelella sp. HB161492]|uniref:hypothetical protein n=1 Tax=Martelella sp. HB161492 TaxID=2720726 RepID=UPI001592150D|nr:hypothetical protein [Martelella sp. HB161492]